MSEAVEAAPKKAKAEVTLVKMTDGREVGFAGKRKLVKDVLIDESKLVVDGESIMVGAGAVTVRLDFRNGETISFSPPAKLVPQFIGHGASQKTGDETAGTEDVDDMVLHVGELVARLNAGEWSAAREAGDGFAGASIVVKAICEATGKSVEFVKSWLQGKLDAAKARGEKLSRQELYNSFRNPNSKTGAIIKRLEEEKLSKGAKVDADAELAEIGA